MLKFATILADFLTWTQPAFASCPCENQAGRIAREVAAIFQGKVLSVIDAPDAQLDGFGGRRVQVVRFKVLASWKGLPSQYSTVLHLTDECWFDCLRHIGQTMLVFAQSSQQGLWMHYCNLEFGINHGDAWSQRLERLLPGLVSRWKNWLR